MLASASASKMRRFASALIFLILCLLLPSLYSFTKTKTFWLVMCPFIALIVVIGVILAAIILKRAFTSIKKWIQN